MGQTVDFYYDLISPFAHVALTKFAELPTGVDIRPIPVLLGPILAHWGQKGPAEITAKRLHTYRLATFLGQQAGLKMRFPPRHPFNSLAAMRILAGGKADLAIVRRAFDFVFIEGRAPDNEDELLAFAAFLELPVALTQDDAAKAALRANTDQAIAAGVFGVPSFGLHTSEKSTGSGGELFWGVDAMPMLTARLGDAEFFTRDPYMALNDIEIGVKRKI